MSQVVNLVQGWTERVDFILSADGVVIDLTGRTVTISAYDKNGTDPAFVGAVAIVDATAGKVGFTPNSGDLLASESPYSVRFKVMTDGYYVPNGDASIWVVSK